MNEQVATARVLIADDDPVSRLFVAETLEQAKFQAHAVVDGREALDFLRRQSVDLALLDVDMPGLDGYEVCRAVRGVGALRYLPVVMITGHDDAGSIERAYQAGATDFISKPVNWTLLPHRLRYILRNADADRRLRYLALNDALTGLPNHESLTGWVSESLASTAHSTAEGVAVLQIAVPAGARIRATFGPDAGDGALSALAHRLRACLAAFEPQSDRAILARDEGDRFVACLRSGRVEERAAEFSEHVVRALADPVLSNDHEFFMIPAIGVACSPRDGADARSLFTRSLAAANHALVGGSSRPEFYTAAIGDQVRERLGMEAALREAVRAERLTLFFQPKFRVADGALTGVEALLRWFDPELGEISPARFIPLAEESGLILEIGRWVIRAAARQVMNWANEDFHTTIAINLSARQFLHDDPAALIRTATAECAIDPRSLLVELTESALIGNLASVHAGLLSVRELGCGVAVDDFGTGYSSLAYLKGLPVTELKLDKAFLRQIDSDAVNAAICQAVLSLATTLGLSVTAEGVETAGQLAWLRDHHCDEAQGFLLAMPAPGHRVLARYRPAAASVEPIAGRVA